MKRLLQILILIGMLVACSGKKEVTRETKIEKPYVTELGRKVMFPDTTNIKYFKFDTIDSENLSAELTAPARVSACVVKSIKDKTYNLVLFNDPDLTANFSVYLERLANIRTYNLNLERVKDLNVNGAATGREVIEAQNILNNEEAAILENEARFMIAGLDPEDFQSHKVGTAWIICDIPEDDIEKLKPGSSCKIKFNGYGTEVFMGVVENIGDAVDNVTRMVKLRIEIHNNSGKIKAGMFATVEFGVAEGKFLCVPNDAVITVQGKDYVFVRKTRNEFDRREVTSGQQINNKIIIFDGLQIGEIVVTDGVMQLKGLSFGY